LITANQAAEQGRPVYAVPGPIDRPTSQGCHRLIQEGAKLVMGVEDILEEFGQLELLSEDEAEETRPDLSEEESALFALLSGMEVGIEDLIRQADLPSQVVATTLMRLEMKRLVKQLPGKHFVRC
jgi:DNA processing protein